MCNCSETETAASPMPFSGNHTHPLATTCTAGVIELATAAEAVANPTFIDALAITPYTLGHYTGLVGQVAGVDTADLLLVRDVSANKDVSYTFGALKDAVTPPQATTENLGLIELATNAEVIAGTDDERAVTPAGLKAWEGANPSTETERGLIELATTDEAVAGTDTERAVTPAGLVAWSKAEQEANRPLLSRAHMSSDINIGEDVPTLLPFDSLTTDQGNPSDVSLNSNALVLARSGTYLVRASSALFLGIAVQGLSLTVIYRDSQGNELRSGYAGSGDHVTNSGITSYDDFAVMPAGGTISVYVNIRGEGTRRLLAKMTELSVLRIAD